MRKWGGLSLLGVCVLLVGIQVIPVDTTNPAVDPGRTIEATVPIPPEVTAILGRACQDCHSNRTEWPWYSRVAPMSWLVVNHVKEGRGELNFSEWGAYAARRKDRKLKEICEQVTRGEMPLFSYTIVHRQAKLSDQDKQKVCQWAETTRQSQGRVLAAAAPPRG